MKIIKVKDYIYSLEGIRRIGHIGATCIMLKYADGTFDTIDFNDGEEKMCESCFNAIYEILGEN